MRETIHAAFHHPDSAARAVGALLDHGVDPSDVSILVQTPPDGWKVGEPEDAITLKKQAKDGITVTTPQDAIGGGLVGTGIGAGIGILAALAAIAVPGVGLVLGGSAMAAGLALGTTAAGTIAGATVGYLKDQGIDEDRARTLSERVSSGGALLSVIAPSNSVLPQAIRGILGKYSDEDQVTYAVAELEENPISDYSLPQENRLL